jgi:hypothetical protein
MRSAECQVAVGVADHFTPAAASAQARLVGSGPAVLPDLAQPPVDLDQVPASVHLVQ